jgi:hypothetical protein
MHRPENAPAAPDTVPIADGNAVLHPARVELAGQPGDHSASGMPRMLNDGELTAWARLRRMRGPGEQRALLLALLLTPGSARELQAFGEECHGVVTADGNRKLVDSLPAAARLSALEAVLAQCAELPLAERQALLMAVRRVMCADGRVRPLDRLSLLLVRHRLHGPAPLHRGGTRDSNELAGLPLAQRLAIAELSAYLARLVPAADPYAVVGTAGAAWHRAVVLAIWGQAPNPPACQVPASDALVQVLRTVQELGWMRRPMLARTWVDAALAVTAQASSAEPGRALSLDGAEALRLACGLLDTPMPPELARCFSELPDHA